MAFNVDLGSHSPDNLVVGGVIQTAEVVVEGAADLVRGSVLGQISASKNYQIAVEGAGDGSETPVVILGQDVTLSAGNDAVATVYLTGQFDAASVTADASLDDGELWAALSARGIFLKTVAS